MQAAPRFAPASFPVICLTLPDRICPILRIDCTFPKIQISLLLTVRTVLTVLTARLDRLCHKSTLV
jgi:hypothetical protein